MLHFCQYHMYLLHVMTAHLSYSVYKCWKALIGFSLYMLFPSTWFTTTGGMQQNSFYMEEHEHFLYAASEASFPASS